MADPSSFSSSFSSSSSTSPDPNPTTTEKYLAKSPSACCFAGSLHEGVPRGTVETDIFGGIPTYVSRPNFSGKEEGKMTTTPTPTSTPANGYHHVLLYFPDVWGLSDNAKLMMDAFADAGGFLVVGMDYFLGVCFSLFLFYFFISFSGSFSFFFFSLLSSSFLCSILIAFWECPVLPFYF